jgi:hypothetical protein
MTVAHKEKAAQQEAQAKQKAAREAAAAEALKSFKSEIAVNDKSIRKATSYLIKALDHGATQRGAAEAVGKSVSWVNRLVKWAKADYPACGPFSADSKARRERDKAKRVSPPKQPAPGIGHNNPPADKPVEPAAPVTGSAERSIEQVMADSAALADKPIEDTAPATAKSNQINATDIALDGFTVHVLDLIRRTAKHSPKRFAGTAVPGDELLKLGEFLTELGQIKSSETTSKALQ